MREALFRLLALVAEHMGFPIPATRFELWADALEILLKSIVKQFKKGK